MYHYEHFKPWLLSDEGQRAFIKFRDRALAALHETGAFTLGRAINWSREENSFKSIALVDRMVEIGDIVQVPREGYSSQDQPYVKASSYLP